MRGQVSFEFFVAFSFLILFFLASVMIYDHENRSSQAFLSRMRAQAVASDFSRAINGVYQCGSGCSYVIQLRQDYSLKIYGKVVEVAGNLQVGQAPLVTDRIELHSATPGAYIRIVNNNGVVELHDA
ncbi:MAG: hypothetical protein Sv326_0582 [Candidatus Fermentimicrarchaeum limneticum]|uniref:Uncharacterized protein n=1 Tax=Fermentimicrarchaeum limneticum TaxID=2795018 RepID=A0A7D6BA45_FERL1|nr:MAG: hypothetical protein Sv326_0582 [Candidatus Fermentimicrarchaeum limneticum]